MDTDTNPPDESDLDDLDGLAASLDDLRLWCELDGSGSANPAESGPLPALISPGDCAAKSKNADEAAPLDVCGPG